MSYNVVDLFSGSGGMSYGFQAHPLFKVVGAVDAQVGKPSSGVGTLDCNGTYFRNIGIQPTFLDLRLASGDQLLDLFHDKLGEEPLDVLIACPPCTGFSRANPKNHLQDDPRNNLVRRVAEWVKALRPKFLVMENARELIKGNFSNHLEALTEDLASMGYAVVQEIHMLSDFGLPQRRERALVIASRCYSPRTLRDLWDGFRIDESAVCVRAAIEGLAPMAAGQKCESDPMHVSPSLKKCSTRRRMELIPADGGSWVDLKDLREADEVLTPAMKRYIALGKFGSHPDVYGRLAWDRPAVTIKRECSHVGNGRYSHPEQHRLLTVREMAILQGFPRDYQFMSNSLANKYRHIGDAVPPLISYQLAWCVHWATSGIRPRMEEVILPKTHLAPNHIIEAESQHEQILFSFAS